MSEILVWKAQKKNLPGIQRVVTAYLLILISADKLCPLYKGKSVLHSPLKNKTKQNLWEAILRSHSSTRSLFHSYLSCLPFLLKSHQLKHFQSTSTVIFLIAGCMYLILYNSPYIQLVRVGWIYKNDSECWILGINVVSSTVLYLVIPTDI